MYFDKEGKTPRSGGAEKGKKPAEGCYFRRISHYFDYITSTFLRQEEIFHLPGIFAVFVQKQEGAALRKGPSGSYLFRKSGKNEACPRKSLPKKPPSERECGKGQRSWPMTEGVPGQASGLPSSADAAFFPEKGPVPSLPQAQTGCDFYETGAEKLRPPIEPREILWYPCGRTPQTERKDASPKSERLSP